MGTEAALRSGLFRVCKGLRRGGVSAIREGVTNLSDNVRMAQYGTKHGHATGVLEVMLASPDVDDGWGVRARSGTAANAASTPTSRRGATLAGSIPPLISCDDPTILAVASEGSNAESLDHTEAIVDAGKHVFYDKPAGNRLCAV